MIRRAVLALAVLLLLADRAAAMRIVSLAPSVTETVFALGAGGELVGVSTYCDYPPAAAAIDRVGTFLTPTTEVILAKRPDLVIAVPSPMNRAPVEALERLGLRVLVVDPVTLDGTRRAIEVIAAAIGRRREGDELLARIEADIAATQAALAGTRPRRTLMVVGHSPLVAVGGGIYLDELIALAGGVNVARDAGGQWPHLSLELVLAEAPEVIIDSAMGTEADAARGSDFWGRLTTLPAVRHGRVRGLRDDALLRPGPRVGEALATLARFIHPERFTAAPTPVEGGAP